MSCLVVLALLSILLSDASASNIVQLTDSNFDEYVGNNEFMLVEFYAPWCGHCKRLEPEYQKAAVDALNLEKKVLIAAIDATSQKGAMAKYDVRGFPTIKLFSSGTVSDYEGQRDARSIIAWLKKKTGDPAKNLRTEDEVREFKSSGTVVIVGFFNSNSIEQEQFTLTARDNDLLSFGAVVDSPHIAEAFEVDYPGIILFTSTNAGFDTDHVIYSGIFDRKSIKQFVNVESLPLVLPFSSATSRQIFTGPVKKHLFFFGTFDNDEELSLVKEVARHTRGEFVVSTIDPSEKRVMDFFRLEEEDLPALRASRLDGIMRKFAYFGSLTSVSEMNAFADGIISGQVRPQLKSEPIPEQPTEQGAVLTVVGRNFDSVVLDHSTETYLKIYAPWCGHCKTLAPLWDQLSSKFALYPTVQFAKMDATVNEHDKVEISGFPSIHFYGMDNKLVKFEGSRDLESLIDFVKRNSGIEPIDIHEDL